MVKEKTKPFTVSEGYVPAVKPAKPDQTRGYVPPKQPASPSKPKPEEKK